MGPADHTEFLGPQIYTLTTVNDISISYRKVGRNHSLVSPPHYTLEFHMTNNAFLRDFTACFKTLKKPNWCPGKIMKGCGTEGPKNWDIPPKEVRVATLIASFAMVWTGVVNMNTCKRRPK